MSSREFIRRARRYARRTGQDFRFDPAHGKGSHGRIYLGSRFTTLKKGDLSRGLVAAMLRQLEFNRKDF